MKKAKELERTQRVWAAAAEHSPVGEAEVGMSGQECTEGAKKKRPGVDTTVVLVQQDGEVGEEEEEEGGSGRSGGVNLVIHALSL